ncbi:MAG: nucleotidyltransferase domain-containing protein [Candidatus Diapherotrites archaeon]
MLFGWNKFMGWRVLEFFLEGGQKIHANRLAKELKLSVGTAQRYLVEYEMEGVLEKEKTGNVISFRINETPLTIELKKAFIISKLLPFVEAFRKENPFVTTLALYGSHAKGSFDGKSDLDLIALSQSKKLGLETLKKIEQKTGKEARIQVFSLAEWRKMLRERADFAASVAKANILLYGEPL